MPIWMSAGFFAGISLLVAIGIHVIVPLGFNAHIPVFYLYTGTLFIASMLGILLSLLMYADEKRKGYLTNISFRERFWIHKIEGKDIFWGIGLFIFWAATLMVIKGVFLKQIELP